ncbi:MAG: 1-acyl-sn-glycerol-3-phosphate acyltransferase [Myxococcota bacterium]
MSSPTTRAPSGRPDRRALADVLSAMAPRFNLAFRWFARRFFGHFGLDDETVQRLRALEDRGSVVYVMRYSSRLDYFLFNTLFVRHGLRLSRFANGIHFYYYHPLRDALRTFLFRRRGLPREVRHAERRERVQALVRAGESMFLFLRTERLRRLLRGRRALAEARELDLIEVAAAESIESGRPVFFVPLALFWRKGPRAESRFLNLSYGAVTRPSDLAKVTSFFSTYRDLAVKTGEPIDLLEFVRERPGDDLRLLARKVRRSMLVYFSAEEKVVEGPTLRSPSRVLQEVLADAGVRRAVDAYAKERGVSIERAERDAERRFREIAANMNSTLLAVLGAVVGWIFRRMFSSIETTGLEAVKEHAKRQALVLVPNHRSYFDFLILSWLFYQNFLVPPHIVARENMSFGPFGFVFRRAGAFFMRRRFDDELYKEVFRAYVSYLVREGFTQEFFIEGGRSRTGKSLAPRFGILSWDVEGFLQSRRRDLLFVPIGITYERLVEEGSMVDELEGGEKKDESMLGLVRARRFLRSRFGSVHIHFDEPISLARALGARRDSFARDGGEAVEAEKRRFIQSLGYRIVERINWSLFANATSVAASVLLGHPHRGMRRAEFVRRMQWTVDLLRALDVRMTQALARDEGGFVESLAFLSGASLVHVESDPRGEIVYFDESRRRALDIYRNAIAHYLAAPSFVARALLGECSRKQLDEDVERAQLVFEHEFFAARIDARRGDVAIVLAHFERCGFAEERDGLWRATEAGEPFLRSLAEQTRGLVEVYAAVCDVAIEQGGALSRRELAKLASARVERARLLGEAERAEALNPTTLANALDWLVRSEVLARADGGGSGADLVRGERFEELASLRDRLAAELAER